VLANNPANANTNGFKSQHAFYHRFNEWLQPEAATPMNLAVNQYGVLGGARLDLSHGNLIPPPESLLLRRARYLCATGCAKVANRD
jgi:hypothetical protein